MHTAQWKTHFTGFCSLTAHAKVISNYLIFVCLFVLFVFSNPGLTLQLRLAQNLVPSVAQTHCKPQLAPWVLGLQVGPAHQDRSVSDQQSMGMFAVPSNGGWTLLLCSAVGGLSESELKPECDTLPSIPYHSLPRHTAKHVHSIPFLSSKLLPLPRITLGLGRQFSLESDVLQP